MRGFFEQQSLTLRRKNFRWYSAMSATGLAVEFRARTVALLSPFSAAVGIGAEVVDGDVDIVRLVIDELELRRTTTVNVAVRSSPYLDWIMKRCNLIWVHPKVHIYSLKFTNRPRLKDAKESILTNCLR